MKKKVLVAGASGYLGQYLVKELKRRNYWVRGTHQEGKSEDPV